MHKQIGSTAGLIFIAVFLIVFATAGYWYFAGQQLPFSQQQTLESQQSVDQLTDTAASSADITVNIPSNSSDQQPQFIDPQEVPVRLTVYTDLNCAFCRQYHPILFEVLAEFGDSLALGFRHFPNLGSVQQAALVACLADGDEPIQAWQFIEFYYMNIVETNAAQDFDALVEQTARAGFAIERCQEEANWQHYLGVVQAQFKEAQAAGVQATPTLLLETASGERELIIGMLTKESLSRVITTYVQRAE